jgi:hypothetical protein
VFLASTNPSQIPHSSLRHPSRINESERAGAQKPKGGVGNAPPKPNGGFMKKNLVVLSLVVVFSLMATLAFAGENMRINVPFAFYMGDQLFPAGEYRFDMNHGNYATASFVNVWAPKGADNSLLMTVAGTGKNNTANQLAFNKYGQKFVLSTVSINGYKATLKMANLERELRSQTVQASGVITVAQK